MVNIEKVCPFCGEVTTIDVTEEQAYAYFFTDELVQNIFPDFTSTEREVLISGMCEKCQKSFFA